MAVMIGSARIDERGRISGGRDGDNNGREVSTQSYYAKPASAPWRVLRPKDAAKAARIAACMRMACANDHIGYNQSKRLTLYNLAKPHGFDVSRVTQNCSTDCSALVRVCCAYAGIAVGNFTTANEARMLLATGEFVEMTDKKYRAGSAYLREGDVLVTPSKGHTVVVLSSGNKAEPLPSAGSDSAVLGTGGSAPAGRASEGEGATAIDKAEPLPNSSRRTAASGSGDQPVRSEAGSTALPKPCEASLGYVTAAPEPAVPDAGSGKRLALKPGKWNLRAGPGTAYPSLGTVSDAVTEVDAGGWVFVRVGDRHGWVSLNAVAAPPERT